METTIAIVLAALTASCLGMLLVPVHLVARGTFTDELVAGSAEASWGLGFVRMVVSENGAELRIAGVRAHRFAFAARTTSKAKAKKRASDPRLVLRIVRRSLASLGLRARVVGRLGTGDPADTATVFAWITSLRMLQSRVDVRGIDIDWLEPALDLEGEVEGWLWPIAILSIAVGEVVRHRRLSAVRGGAA
jgi:hypothetical protein